MKKLIVALAALAAFTGSASAADLRPVLHQGSVMALPITGPASTSRRCRGGILGPDTTR